MTFNKIIENSNIVLTEGAIVERLKSEFNIQMDDAINHAGTIYTHPEILEMCYKQYIAIAQKHHIPIMVMTPTRKVNIESVKRSKFPNKNLIVDACNFLDGIKNQYGDFAKQILIGGLLGCKGNAFSGEKVLTIEEAFAFHRQQTVQFQNQPIDYLFAGIMPEINEAIGMAKAMAETEIPYIISFTLQKNGCLLDGTILADAIQQIDDQVSSKPICYMANCIHPTNLIEALKNNPPLERFCGIQANTSTLSCDELDKCDTLITDDFDSMIAKMMILKNQFKLKILGGCCGTDDVFIEKLAREIIL